MSDVNDMYLVSTALSVIASQEKPVEVDHDLADHMGLQPDPAMSDGDPYEPELLA